jgi:hypothetical protein
MTEEHKQELAEYEDRTKDTLTIIQQIRDSKDLEFRIGKICFLLEMMAKQDLANFELKLAEDEQRDMQSEMVKQLGVVAETTAEVLKSHLLQGQQ